MTLNHEYDAGRILVYLGPSLSLTRAREILPEAIYKPPARQGDLVTDVSNLNPNTIILVDGCFDQNLPVWHKELVFALQFPGVRRIYGTASMGALRAAECDWLGMIGLGQIYQWYRDGVTEDDAEVALLYATRESTAGPVYYPQTVPLCDIRAALINVAQTEITDAQRYKDAVQEFFESMQKVHYKDRTTKVCEDAWGRQFEHPFPLAPQKAKDVTSTLLEFRAHAPEPKALPQPEHLSLYFQALYDRDRRISVNGAEIPQQHIDAHVTLHNPEWERICWDSSNQELALVLCNCLSVTITGEEMERENVRFQQRNGLSTMPEFEAFLAANGWTKPEYNRLMIQNARIRKLQHAMTVTKAYRRNTLSIIDYLRTHQGFNYWAAEARRKEERLTERGTDESLSINMETPVFTLLADHMEEEGLELHCSMEEYLLETGFSNLTELGVALSRIAALKE